jgi:hypothetical protein
MKERKNVWGNAGCELPDGKLCNVCCVLAEVELVGESPKPAFSPCQYLGENGEGCVIHKGLRSKMCSDWHCSSVGTNFSREIISGALALGSVTDDEARNALENLMGDMESSSLVEEKMAGIKAEASRLFNRINKTI